MEQTLSHIRGFLLDLDGTLYRGLEALPGAAEFAAALRDGGYPVRFATNTTSCCRATLAAKLKQMGIAAEEEEIFAPPHAAARHLRARGVTRVFLLVQEDARREFAGIAPTDEGAEVVVVGDLGDEWTFGKLNRAFQLLMGGAELITLGKTRYWEAADGLRLDAGPFATALEFAAGKEALVLGKPSAPFFQLAVESLGLTPGQVAMVGDNIDTDIAGAHQAGLFSILVRTGTFRSTDLGSPLSPDLIVDSLTDLAHEISSQRSTTKGKTLRS